MECNCNNNNNGGVIPWVRGNRLPLCICIYQMNVGQGTVSTMAYNTMTRTPYVIQADDTVTVTMKSGFRSVEMPFTTDGNKVLVIDNGELPTGTYTVEVTIERGSGERGRWQESRQVRIYENTDEAILGEMYSIEADLFFWAKGDTGVGIANITSNPDNTLTITMTDGTTYTTQAMKGDKGDKGDQGEKGTSIVSFDVTGQTDTSVIYTVTFSDDTTQEVAVPKGPQGDTGLTGNGIASTTLNSDYTLTIAYTDGTTYTTSSIRGAQGVQGVSIIAFTQTGETSTNTLYNVVFSDGRTQSVAIPKGLKGDKGDTGNTGVQGAQGPKGDTVTATDYTLYNVQGSSSEGAMSQDATTKAISAQTGYYTCGAAADKVDKVAAVENGNLYKRTLGGHFKVKMTNANTASGVTLQVGSETATTLWYNGAAASASNTWDAGEVLSVYYDGTYYQASNAQGGGGKAEKIKYDNSESGLTAENVQGALDEIQENTGIIKLMDLTFCQPQNFNLEQNVTKWSSSSEYKCFVVPRCLFGDRLYLLPLTYKISYAFLQYCNLRSKSTVQFAGGMTHADTIAVGSSKWVDIPNDCNCIYFYLSLYDIANINTLYSVYSVSKVKDDLENLIEPHWDTKEFNEAKSSIMPSGYNSNTGIYENTYDPAVTYNRAISTIPFKLEKGEWIKITMDSSVKAFVMSIGENNYYYGNDTGGPQTGGTIIAQGDGNKKVIWTAFANDANILTANDVISHISIVKGYDYRYEPTKVSVSERYNTTIQSDLVSNLALCSWAVYDAQGVAFPIPFQEPYNTRCCSASIEWIEDDILVSFPNTILSCCYDMGLDKIYKGRASLVVDKPYIVKGGRYIILWFKNADDSEISSLSDFVAQISVTNISAEDTVKGLVENNIFNAFNDTSGRKVFGIARSNNHPHEHLSIYTQMDFFNEYYQLSSLQSSPYNKEKGYILHLTGSTDGTICPIDGIGQYPMTLPSMGHENDAFIDGDEMWTADGSALGSGGFTDIYKYLFSTGTATKYTLDISSSTGATMVVGGICKYSDTELLIAAYDYRGNYNNEGDELRIYKVNKSTMAVELLFTTQWDGWFVQGMTYVNGFAYIASNMIPPISGDAYYSGINIWKIDMLGTPAHIDTLQLFGDFEPEGMDSYSLNGIDYLLLGIGKYSTIGQLTRMVAF